MSRLAPLLLLTGALACGSARSGVPAAPAADAATQSAPAGALGGLAELRVAVAPVAGLQAPPAFVGALQGGSAPYLRRVDSLASDALRARGLGARWLFADALERAHRRNAAFVSDPHALSVAQLRDAPPGRAPTMVREPLASQLRALVATQADVRLVLLPLELRVDSVPAGWRGTLRLAVVDARTTEVRWMGDVQTAAAPAPWPPLATLVATTLADLIVAR